MAKKIINFVFRGQLEIEEVEEIVATPIDQFNPQVKIKTN